LFLILKIKRPATLAFTNETHLDLPERYWKHHRLLVSISGILVLFAIVLSLLRIFLQRGLVNYLFELDAQTVSFGTDMAQCEANFITQYTVAVKINGASISLTGTTQPFHDSKPIYGELRIPSLGFNHSEFCNTV